MGYLQIDEDEFQLMRQERSDALSKVEALTVQLQQCSMVAQGYAMDLPKTAYGWSPAYEQVRKLRRKYDEAIRIVDEKS